MALAGYIYVLLNPSMPGLVKIGKTTRHPKDRVEELSQATGVPQRFILAYNTYFKNISQAESDLHQILTDRGHRVSRRREFFRAPLEEIIEIILDLHKHSGTKAPSRTPEKDPKLIQREKWGNLPTFEEREEYDLSLALGTGELALSKLEKQGGLHYWRYKERWEHRPFLEKVSNFLDPPVDPSEWAKLERRRKHFSISHEHLSRGTFTKENLFSARYGGLISVGEGIPPFSDPVDPIFALSSLWAGIFYRDYRSSVNVEPAEYMAPESDDMCRWQKQAHTKKGSSERLMAAWGCFIGALGRGELRAIPELAILYAPQSLVAERIWSMFFSASCEEISPIDRIREDDEWMESNGILSRDWLSKTKREYVLEYLKFCKMHELSPKFEEKISEYVD